MKMDDIHQLNSTRVQVVSNPISTFFTQFPPLFLCLLHTFMVADAQQVFWMEVLLHRLFIFSLDYMLMPSLSQQHEAREIRTSQQENSRPANLTQLGVPGLPRATPTFGNAQELAASTEGFPAPDRPSQSSAPAPPAASRPLAPADTAVTGPRTRTQPPVPARLERRDVKRVTQCRIPGCVDGYPTFEDVTRLAAHLIARHNRGDSSGDKCHFWCCAYAETKRRPKDLRCKLFSSLYCTWFTPPFCLEKKL